VNGMLIFLSAAIGAGISAAFGVGWKLVRRKLR
jgi:hypothetical protein